MRKKIIAGNWKMHNNLSETVSLISELKKLLSEKGTENIAIVCPPFTSLETAGECIKNSDLKLGAQNFYFQDKGAFTGEISADMLKSVGCEYVILGHSERRTIFAETNDLINKKIIQAISKGITPIFCIGETLEEREKNVTNQVIETQIREGLANISSEDAEKIIFAYEPVWAIGTGKTATPEQAQEVHNFIRNLLKSIFSATVAEKVIIQYGGSVKPENAVELLSQPDIDGALVGGACLAADSFYKIITAV